MKLAVLALPPFFFFTLERWLFVQAFPDQKKKKEETEREHDLNSGYTPIRLCCVSYEVYFPRSFPFYILSSMTKCKELRNENKQDYI